MGYEELIHTIIDPIISKPEAILIRTQESENQKDIDILIVAENDDCARLIGKKGVVANAIRNVASINGKINGKHLHLKFEAFDQK